MKKLLLHICCAPDATVAVERLRSEYQVTAYFYNPNIHPREEYELRAAEMKRLAKKIDIPLIVGPYDTDTWFEKTRGLEKEPEGGDRCTLCFQIRLKQTAKTAVESNFDLFATVLTVSPHKNAELINRMGQELGNSHGVSYLKSNFKKKDGFKRSIELSRLFNLYRQNYCGCIYSRRDNE